MSSHLKAFIPDNDPTYQKHLRILTMCKKENVSLPKETADYFGTCDEPEEKLQFILKRDDHYTKWQDEMREGFEVDLTKLPKEVTKIRFYNSY